MKVEGKKASARSARVNEIFVHSTKYSQLTGGGNKIADVFRHSSFNFKPTLNFEILSDYTAEITVDQS